ncbi:MAG: hypothetical protein HGB34_03140 [Candidatus Moranbacteria bacterium]|nr:hypothetical protein [Candidatus Moranbacteria bacterium]NTW75872.1 hypothetical protein [Candidatus Moranbacteria bacterium]
MIISATFSQAFSSILQNAGTNALKIIMNATAGIADTIGMLGHGIQMAEAAIIDAVGTTLGNVVDQSEPTLDALLDWLDENPAIDTIVDVFAEVTTLVLEIFGFEVPSFSGFGCYGM